ncbi:NAD-dependent protein deacetylase [Halomonas sp. ML-15]|uniref:NAD-dependent protein deacetylase n=1 Tax=Halomonas sp. ML-15 TaxID=2773305 RepID=UPI001746C33B|nr:NAD-dependent protein deacetylase [Halomonas sp. ML-15]MBD3898390.1 NAD-dependent protein deacetylase [Halomonas sp. ML-15]
MPPPSAPIDPDPLVLKAAAALATFIADHPRLAVISGAGVSTDSGIPDYRGRDGAWKRPPPMNHQDFMASHAARQRYWARALVGFRALSEARPGAAHRGLAMLERRGHLDTLITQNVDGLHQRAGNRRVIDLHGRAEIVRCMSCDARRMRHDLHAELAASNPRWLALEASVGPDGDADLEHDFSDFHVPGCARCGRGVWKPDVVFFGDQVPAARVTAAADAVSRADALLVVGSSLMVYSGYRFARQAAAEGKPLACLNLGHTRADALYHLKLEAPVGDTLGALSQYLDI